MMYIGNQKYVPLINSNKVTPTIPDHYDAEIEYLQSTGTQWIDTGIGLKGSMKAEYDFSFSPIPANINVIFGSYEDNAQVPRFQFYYQNGFKNVTNSTYCGTTGNGITESGNAISGKIYSAVTITKSPQVSNRSIWIFARNNDIVNYLPSSNLFIYCWKLYCNNNLIMDLIPVRVGQVGYMYDKVSGRLFGNKGTGEFILGPDINT